MSAFNFEVFRISQDPISHVVWQHVTQLVNSVPGDKNLVPFQLHWNETMPKGKYVSITFWVVIGDFFIF